MGEYHYLIQTYGYWLMAFGALIEGETFLLAGGIAASQGYFHLPGLILLAVIGSMFHDHVFYIIGHFGGRPLLHRFKVWESKSQHGLELVEKYGVWLILALRFLYGLRTIVPLILGVSPIRYYKFLIFDLIGGVVWSSVFILGGYFFGFALAKIIKEITEYESKFWMFLIIVLLLGCVVGIGIYLFRKINQGKAQ